MTLHDWLRLTDVRADGWTIRRLAAELRHSPATVSRMVNGHNVPRPRDVIRIFEITGGAVQPNDWFPEVMRQLRVMQARARRNERERQIRAAARVTASREQVPA